MTSLRNVNKVILVGNLGADPEIRYTAKGTAVANISMATNRSRKDDDGKWSDETQWHRIVIWGKRAETCKQFLSRGSRIYVEGFLQSRNWKDQDGRERTTTEIQSEDIKFLGHRLGGEPETRNEGSIESVSG